MKHRFQNGILVLASGLIIANSALCLNDLRNLNLKSESQNSNRIVTTANLIVKNELRIAEQLAEFETKNQEPEIIIEEWHPFFEISNEDRYTIQCIVAGEAGYESMEGKMSVAQCLMNAMKKENKSAKQIKRLYKYSGWKTNLENQNPEMWTEVVEAVNRVFDNGETVTDKPILFFYAPKYCSGSWHRTLPQATVIGDHSFHYLKTDLTADWFVELRGEME